MEVYKEHKELKKLKNSYILGFYVRNFDYNEIIKRMEIVEDDLRRLIQFKKNIIEGRVKGYGYEVLES